MTLHLLLLTKCFNLPPRIKLKEVAGMGDKPSSVFTIDELVAYLRVPKSTLYKLVREGKVPAQKVDRHWRFRKEAIDAWLAETDTRDQRGGRNDRRHRFATHRTVRRQESRVTR